MLGGEVGSAILVDDNRNGVNTWAVDIYRRTRVVGVATELFFRLVGSWAFDQTADLHPDLTWFSPAKDFQ